MVSTKCWTSTLCCLPIWMLDAHSNHRNEFYHEHFKRDQPDLLKRIVRRRSPSRRPESSASNDSPPPHRRRSAPSATIETLAREAATANRCSIALLVAQVSALIDGQKAMQSTIQTLAIELATLKAHVFGTAAPQAPAPPPPAI